MGRAVSAVVKSEINLFMSLHLLSGTLIGYNSGQNSAMPQQRSQQNGKMANITWLECGRCAGSPPLPKQLGFLIRPRKGAFGVLFRVPFLGPIWGSLWVPFGSLFWVLVSPAWWNIAPRPEQPTMGPISTTSNGPA